MNYFKMVFQYLGEDFKGWQIQPEGFRTVQGEIEKVLKEVSKNNFPFKFLGASRTDAGVHAICQVAKLEWGNPLPGENLFKALNSLLPQSIRLVDIQTCSENFHPIFSKSRKSYSYFFSFGDNFVPTQLGRIVFFKYNLDLSKMKKGAELFKGVQDFQNYYCEGSEIHSTEREIYNSQVIIHSNTSLPFLPKEFCEFKISGNGFLKQMVRLIMGALVELGREKIDIKYLEQSLLIPMERRVGPVVPPEGLYLTDCKTTDLK